MQKILFDDKLNLTNLVVSGKKTQTRRQEMVLHNTMWRWRDCDPVMDEWNPEENGIHVYFSRSSRGISDMIVHPKYKKGEEVSVGMSYRNILNVINNSNLGITEEYYRKYAADIYGIKSLESQKGFGNKLFINPELMLHTLTISDVNFEQFEDISDEDAIKEGIAMFDNNSYGYTKNGEKSDKLYESPSEAFIGMLNNELNIKDMTFWCVVYDFDVHTFSLVEKIKNYVNK